MKYNISSIVLAFSFLFVVNTQKTFAQKNKRKTTTTTTTRTTTTTTKKGISKNSKRVQRKKVTYKKPKTKVVSVRTLPNKRVIKHKGANYYYANNKFYSYSGGRYTVTTPKVGFRIKNFPTGYKTIRYNNRNYRWLNGMFYLLISNNEYEIVEPEIGTVIYELPNNYERVVINNQTYYEFSNVLYEKIQINGTRAYEVVGFIEQ